MRGMHPISNHPYRPTHRRSRPAGLNAPAGRLPGDHTRGATPVPIPNTAVKPAGPMIVQSRESRSSPGSSTQSRRTPKVRRLFCAPLFAERRSTTLGSSSDRLPALFGRASWQPSEDRSVVRASGCASNRAQPAPRTRSITRRASYRLESGPAGEATGPLSNVVHGTNSGGVLHLDAVDELHPSDHVLEAT